MKRYVRFDLCNGYCGCDETRKYFFDYDDSIADAENVIIEDIGKAFNDIVYEYLYDHEEAVTGGGGWEDDRDCEDYYLGEYCSWTFISEEEYLKEEAEGGRRIYFAMAGSDIIGAFHTREKAEERLSEVNGDNLWIKETDIFD